MNWKKFLKPNLKKIIVFVLLYLFVPYPLMLWELGTGSELRTIFLPFTSPFMLKVAVESIKYGLDIYQNPSVGLLFLVFPFIWLIIVYFLSCWIVVYKEKKRPKSFLE